MGHGQQLFIGAHPNGAGSDVVHPYPVRREIQRESFRHVVQAGLDAAVDTRVRVSPLAARGADVDDAALEVMVDHIFCGVVHQHDVGPQVDADQVIKVFLRDVLQGQRNIDAGIVDPDVDFAEGLGGRGGNGGNPPAAVNGGTTRTNGALTASTNTPSASTVPGAQDTDQAPQDLTEIEDQKTPLANAQDKWALLNLILMILTVLLCLWMAAGTLLRNQDDDRNEDEKTVKRKKILKLLSLIPAIAAVIAFILTEDMTLPMQMTDKWTILMLVIFIVQVVMRVLTKNKKDEEDNNKNAYA